MRKYLEVIKLLLKSGNNKSYHKICPLCGSSNLKIVPAGTIHFHLFSHYYCEDCNANVQPIEGNKKFILAYREKIKKFKEK